MHIQEIITELNIARISGMPKEKSEEIKEIIQGLIPYAEFEKRIKIDLITLYKTEFAEGIYFKSNKTHKIEYKRMTASSIAHGAIIFGFDETIVEFKDYGKTWALTKEELE